MTRVAIVGGGIGGVSTALALLQRGIDAQIYEQAPAPGEIGAGLGLWPNALRVLDSLGCGAAVEGEGFKVGAMTHRRWVDGQVLSSTPFDDPQAPMRPLTFHRAELLSALLTSLPEGTYNVNHRLQDLDDEGDRVRLRFENGSEVEADVAIGADGIRSQTAMRTGLAEPARPSGFAAYRGLIPVERLDGLDINEQINVWLGPGRHFAHYWVSGGRFLVVIGYVPSDHDSGPAWRHAAAKEEMAACFEGWDPHVLEVTSRLDEVMLFGLYDRMASDSWNRGRIALLGDAAHPMLPFFGQGAAQAIEDAAALAVLLEGLEAADIPRRLDAYSSMRFERVRRVQDVARHFAVENNLPDGPEQEERDVRMAKPSRNPWAASAWLYDTDPAAEAEQRLVAGV
jgi:salicylate hydroxylase